MERTVKVTGKAKIAVRPDMIRLAIVAKGEKANYEEALGLTAEQTKLLWECFEGLGFERSDLKTVSFQVHTKYENCKEKGAWKQKFVGYEFRQELKIEFDVDNKMLGKILYALARSTVEPEFHIVYTVKDEEAVKNILLGKAVEDARTKAEVLTKAAGVKLGKMIGIDYSWEEMEIVSHPMGRMMALAGSADMAAATCEMDVEPEDISVSDHVTVVWAIE